jgi:cytochrome c553
MKKTLVLATMFGFAVVLNASAADAKANWDSLCAKCHGKMAKARPRWARNWASRISRTPRFRRIEG